MTTSKTDSPKCSANTPAPSAETLSSSAETSVSSASAPASGANTPALGVNTPATLGFHMPGEFEPHAATIVIWPERPGSWTYGAQAAREAFTNVIAAIAASETVYVAVSPQSVQSACEMLFEEQVKPGNVSDSWRLDAPADSASAPDSDAKTTNAAPSAHDEETLSSNWRSNVEVFLLESDDAWARDIAPTFVVNPHARNNSIDEPTMSTICGVNWQFNAWGGEVDGAYAHWQRDNAFAQSFCERFGYSYFDASPFVLEGGSIHSDGEGTLMVTESCLLSKGRNPNLNKQEIEERLKAYLGAKKVLWLPRGIYNDETNEHVDNICAFLRPREVVLAWTDNVNDPQYELSQADLAFLETQTDARGRHLTVHKLPIPDVPVCITQHDVEGYIFEEGEDVRTPGERLAASYVNFYFVNNAILLPTFGGENEKSDRRAVELMQTWMPDRKVIPIPARDILTGGGNIHCITQQIPAVQTKGTDGTANATEA